MGLGKRNSELQNMTIYYGMRKQIFHCQTPSQKDAYRDARDDGHAKKIAIYRLIDVYRKEQRQLRVLQDLYNQSPDGVVKICQGEEAPTPEQVVLFSELVVKLIKGANEIRGNEFGKLAERYIYLLILKENINPAYISHMPQKYLDRFEGLLKEFGDANIKNKYDVARILDPEQTYIKSMRQDRENDVSETFRRFEKDVRKVSKKVMLTY